MVTNKNLILTDEFKTALEHLESGKHIFLTGKAGTGKSTLIKYFMDRTERNVVVAAPTGIAALNVDGYTIHRLFSLRPGITVEDIQGRNYFPRQFYEVLKTLDTLIIDEASMVRADLFDVLSASLRRFGPKPWEPFGGVQIVLVGDLYQLPPVVVESEQDYFSTRYASPYFFSSDEYAANDFTQIQLTRVFRQTGDTELTDILNAIREGTIDEASRELLNTRTRTDFKPSDDQFWLTLTTTNRIASARNRAALNQLSGDESIWRGEITGEVDAADLATDEELRYKIGAQVMLLTNDPANQYVNGTLGVITAIKKNSRDEPQVTIRTRDDREVEVGLHTWESTRPIMQGGRIVREVIGTFRQLPFRLAWAITIHKSQGQTLDRLIVDLSGGTFAYGQLYVALSRCTSMAGLILQRDVLPKDLKTDQRIRRFLTTQVSDEIEGYAYFGFCSAGNVGRQTRPRPVEIAAVTSDGREVHTLVNPESDLYNSRSDYEIEAKDVLPAPRLAEAWPALLDRLEGLVPVGIDIDRELGYIDFELKRNGIVSSMPLGISIPASGSKRNERISLAGPTALERARAVARIAERITLDDNQTEAFPEPDRPGYLLPRGTDPEDIQVLGVTQDGDLGRFRELAVARVSAAVTDTSLDEVLRPEARICFTGTVLDSNGESVDRKKMEKLAVKHGFHIANNVSKTRCDVLVTAEQGSQSSKARKAMNWGKPIVLATDFLAWCADK